MTEMSLPRISRMAGSSSPTSSRPRKRMLPATMRPGGIGINPRMERAPTLLPQPDSPTIPSISPRSSRYDRPSTARNIPSRVKNHVFRSSMTSSGSTGGCALSRTKLGFISVKTRLSHSPGDAGVEHASQPITHQIDGQDGQAEQQARTQDQPGRDLEERAALGHDVPPARHLRWRAGAEKAQDRLDQHRCGANVRRLHDQRRKGVGQDVLAHDAPRAGTGY